MVPHERLELVKNPDYWDPNRVPKQDRVVLLPMPEATTRAAALLSGQVDIVEAPSPDMIPRLKSAGMNVITHPYPHIWPYLLNFTRGPFQDLRVRQAANYAINRDEVVELLQGVAIPSYATYTPSQRNYGHPFEYKWNADKATALLKEANCYPCEIFVAISTSGSGPDAAAADERAGQGTARGGRLQGQVRRARLEHGDRRLLQRRARSTRNMTP